MDTPLRVLIIEDSDRDVALEVRALEAGGYRVTYAVAETAAEMKAALIKQAFDIVLSDHDLPQFDAPEALAVFKQSGLDIPFIIVSGTIGEEAAVALVKAGAHDYILKDRLSRLASAVERALKDVEELSRRKQAEEALRKSEEQFRTSLENAPDGVYMSDLEGNFLYGNRRCEEIIGYKREELIGKNFLELNILHEHSFARAAELLQVNREGRSTTNDELVLIRKDGCLVPVEINTSVLQHNGQAVVLAFIRDITDRKQAEKALRESEKKYRLLADNVNDVIFVLDMNLNYTYISPSVKILRGYESAEVLKQQPVETLTPSSKDLAMRTLSEVMELEKSEHGEIPISRTLQLEMIRKDGSTVWTEVKLSFIRDENQRPMGILGVTRDITERKQAEEELLRTLSSLQKAFGATIQVMVSAVEVRDPYTAGHQLRSAGLARAIATEMGLPQEKIDGIRMAGSIHDIGKLSLPAEILSKPTKLTETEYSLIKEHSQTGYDILKDVESPWPLAQIVYQHHERMDGSGYPRNLKGDEILIEARIMAVADVVEAMASFRPYRPALGIDKALEEIEKNKGTLYDHTVAEACLSLFREKGYQL